MGKLLRTVGKEADIVILDTPPVLAVSDAVALTPMLDAAILVVRQAKTSRERLREAMRNLGGVGAPMLGVIVNGVTEGDGYYGYGYYGYYGYGRRPGGAAQETPVGTRPFSPPGAQMAAQPAANGNGRVAAKRRSPDRKP
jgi:Mrp family chromosome partitioning ATPase